MKVNTGQLCIICMVSSFASFSLANPALKIAVREILELASRKSGREIAEVSAREAAEQTLERSAAKFGNKALAAAGDGGLELIEATAKYGDDVMRVAVEASPAARRQFALDAEKLLPLARRVGPEALEVEAKAPGLAGKFFENFGDSAGKRCAKSVTADDIPRLVQYAERANSQATRNLLLKTYQKDGKTLFECIPPKLVLAGGLTASMIHVAHRVTAPCVAIAKAIGVDPQIAINICRHFVTISGCLIGLITLLLLWRFNLVPWCRPQKVKTTTVPSEAS